MKSFLEAAGIKSMDDLPKFVPPKEPLEPIKKILRTPESRFDGLGSVGSAFPFQSRYLWSKSHGDVRIHYVEDGPRDAPETILLMHGEPTWCFLYRKMIPLLTKAGFRVVAPDLVGFGKSDKPADRGDYSYERQVNWMSDLVVGADLQNVTMFCQDWGGLIGLRVAARLPDRFQRIVVSNTGLPVGGNQAGETFRIWASVVSQRVPSWTPIIMGGCKQGLDDDAADAYEAPFPSEEYKPASRVFPQLVPQWDEHSSVEENKGAWKRVFSQWTKPLLTLFADSDAVSRGGEKVWIEQCPGAKGQKHAIIKDAGHFIQEDQPEELCERILEFIQDNPVKLYRPASRL